MNPVQPTILNYPWGAQYTWDAVARVVVSSLDDSMSGLDFCNNGFRLHAHRYYKGEYDEVGVAGLYLANYGWIGDITRKYGSTVNRTIDSRYTKYSISEGTVNGTKITYDPEETFFNPNAPMFELFVDPAHSKNTRIRNIKLTIKNLDPIIVLSKTKEKAIATVLAIAYDTDFGYSYICDSNESCAKRFYSYCTKYQYRNFVNPVIDVNSGRRSNTKPSTYWLFDLTYDKVNSVNVTNPHTYSGSIKNYVMNYIPFPSTKQYWVSTKTYTFSEDTGTYKDVRGNVGHCNWLYNISFPNVKNGRVPFAIHIGTGYNWNGMTGVFCDIGLSYQLVYV